MNRHWKGRDARRLLLWTAVSFVGLQLGLNLYMEARHAEVYDPEYRDRIVLLRQRVQEHPERPLFLFVGSSRIMTGVAPEQLPALETASGEQVLPFNAVHTGAGALHNLLMVRRLLREGLHPRWMVIEVVPYLLPAAQHSTLAKQSLGRDLTVLRRHIGPTKLYGWYFEERLTAIVNHRHAFLRYVAPGLPFQDVPWDCMPMEPLGGKTWDEAIPDQSEIERRTAIVRSSYYGSLQKFYVHETSRKAMHELLEVCRRRNIQVALLMTPESSEFRSWYPPAAHQTIERFCDEIKSAYGVPIIDARAWLPDSDFSDGHHVLPEGAKRLTARLNTEVVQPLVNGKLR
jgi:hypothetical protein